MKKHSEEPQNDDGEFEFETDIEAIDDTESTDKIKNLREKLKACEAEKQEYLDGWQRAKADLVNLKRTSIEDSKRAQERGCEKILEAIAPVLDSFDMAMSGNAWQNVDATWRKGVESIHTQLLNALSAHGLSIIDPTGTPFNPHEHESVSMEETDDKKKDHTVTQTLQKGLKLGDRVVRPAKVVIATFTG